MRSKWHKHTGQYTVNTCNDISHSSPIHSIEILYNANQSVEPMSCW